MNNNPLSIKIPGMGRGREKKFEGLVKEALAQLGCEVEKLHGTEYQTGLPDLLVLGPRIDGFAKIRLIELKWSNSPLRNVGQLFGLLKGRQKSFIPLWAHKGASIWIVCGCLSKTKESVAYITHAGERAWDKLLVPYEIVRAMAIVIA